MAANSMCFKEARDARINDNIRLDEYVRHIVAHYGGLRHEEDAEGERPWFPTGFEHEVRSIVLSDHYHPLDDDDSALIYSIFLNAFQGDVAAIRNLLAPSTLASGYYLRPLVAIAMQDGDPQLLRLCLECGFLPTGYLDSCGLLDGRLRKNPSTAWLDVLFEFDFRQWRTDPTKLNSWQSWHYLLYMGADCARWWIQHGGRTQTARGLFEHTKGWPGVATLRVLLDEFGIEWFTDSGTLQIAVRKHDLETVKMLVEAGADVNENVNDWQIDIREHRLAPLSALHEAVYAKSEETIRYLVEHGAKLPRKYIADPYEITPKEYRGFKDLVEELGAVEGEKHQL